MRLTTVRLGLLIVTILLLSASTALCEEYEAHYLNLNY
jgi:hypothetical protein